MDDEFGGDDVDFSAVSVPGDKTTRAPATPSGPRLDAPARLINSGNTGPGVQQPKPQALPARNTTSAILVSPRQKGNPILNNIRALPWEYSDIPADYVLGLTTCALFLSLKYHRLHPEYIYNRIRGIVGKYNLRILLTMIDITNHEEPLKELSKTSLINNVTIVLCWSAEEAGRYLALFKSYENASPTAIKGQQTTGYSDKLVEFITAPRSINKTDAVSLISSFGSVRTAINAAPEDVALVPGFGEKKVQQWCNTVRQPFRVKQAARRGITREESSFALSREDTRASISRQVSRADPNENPDSHPRLNVAAVLPRPRNAGMANTTGTSYTPSRLTEPMRKPDEDEEMAMLEAMNEAPQAVSKLKPAPAQASKEQEENLSNGIAAALAKLRQ